jgi:hypothetical protein
VPAPSASHAQPLAKIVPMPKPSTHVHAVPVPHAKPVAPAAPAAFKLPVPASTSAAWEEDDEPIVVQLPKIPRTPEVDPEHTDLLPRNGRGIGIGVAVGAITALVLSLILLNKPFMRRAPIAARSTPAAVVVPQPASAPVIAPLEPAAPTAPLEPAHP